MDPNLLRLYEQLGGMLVDKISTSVNHMSGVIVQELFERIIILLLFSKVTVYLSL